MKSSPRFSMQMQYKFIKLPYQLQYIFEICKQLALISNEVAYHHSHIPKWSSFPQKVLIGDNGCKDHKLNSIATNMCNKKPPFTVATQKNHFRPFIVMHFCDTCVRSQFTSSNLMLICITLLNSFFSAYTKYTFFSSL